MLILDLLIDLSQNDILSFNTGSDIDPWFEFLIEVTVLLFDDGIDFCSDSVWVSCLIYYFDDGHSHILDFLFIYVPYSSHSSVPNSSHCPVSFNVPYSSNCPVSFNVPYSSHYPVFFNVPYSSNCPVFPLFSHLCHIHFPVNISHHWFSVNIFHYSHSSSYLFSHSNSPSYSSYDIFSDISCESDNHWSFTTIALSQPFSVNS